MERLWKVQRNISEQAPFHESRKKSPQPVCLTSNDVWMSNMIPFKRISRELETSQRAMERTILTVKLKDRICNTIRQRTRVTNIADYVNSPKWKWAEHMA